MVASAAIMWKRGRKTRRSWLVLFRRDGRVERLRLAIFDISEDWLATIVEQYKAEAGLEK